MPSIPVREFPAVLPSGKLLASMGDLTMPERDSYTALELLRLSGLTYRQVDYWRRTHRLFGDAHAGMGSGARDTGYTTVDVRVGRCLARLLAIGVTNEAIHAACAKVREVAINDLLVAIHLTEHVTVVVDLR